MTPIDYGRSFVIGTAASNECRFWIESRLRFIDEHGIVEEYLQGGSCKSENTFVAADLFQPDNYDFLPVFGPELGIYFRRKAYRNENYKSYVPNDKMFGGVTKHLVEAGHARELVTNEEVREATYRMSPIVAQIEIANPDTGLRAIMECPIKTINTEKGGDHYQVDSGPLIFPDLSQRVKRRVELLSLAFVAFNAPHFADFVLEKPTEITPDSGEASCQVHHFSELISLGSVNRLFAL